MKNRLLAIGLVLLIAITGGLPHSRAAMEITNTGAEFRFGRVKSPPRPLKWQVLPARHFRIHFYQGMEDLALRCRTILTEEAYDRVYPDFQDFYTINPLPEIRVILFDSRRDFQNSQASGVPLTATPEGVAHFLVNRLAVIKQPTLRELRGVLIHEVTHIITLHSFRNNFLLNLAGQPPDWLVEGLAEYYMPEETRFPMREGALRDAVLQDKLSNMDSLRTVQTNLDYAQAWSLTDYVARQYGREKLPALLAEFFARGDKDAAYQAVLNISRRELWEDWKADLQSRYAAGRDAPRIRDEYEPCIAGHGQHMQARPAGERRIVFLSTHQSNYFDLYLWEEGKIRRLTDWTVSAYGVSPEGKEILFVSDVEGEHLLYRLALESGEISPFPLDLPNPVDVAWSPAGDRLAVTVNIKGDTDIYLVDLEGKVLARVAGGPYDEYSPAWAPDGRSLVYVAPYCGYDQLYLWDGENSRRLTADGNRHQDPVWGPDGLIYFTIGAEGYYRTATVDPATGEVKVVSPFQETLLYPYPLAGGEILSTVYQAGEYKIYRWRPGE